MDVYSSLFTYGNHRLCTQLGSFCRALYTRCTIPEMHIALNTSIVTTLVQMAFSYTRCIDVYGSPTTYGYHRLCTHLAKSGRAVYPRCTYPQIRMVLNTFMETTLVQVAFSHTRCIDAYGSPSTYIYHSLRTQLGRSRKVLYTRSTIPEMQMALDSSIGTTLVLTVFLYTRYMDVYSFPTTNVYQMLCS